MPPSAPPPTGRPPACFQTQQLAIRLPRDPCATVADMSGRLFRCAPVVLALGSVLNLTPTAFAQQSVAPDAGCMLHKDTYTCNRPSFQQAFDRAHTVALLGPNGVDFGPRDHDLARLEVFAPSSSASQGTLLWAETYRGQGDRPWPAQVHALLTQFQQRFQRGR